MTTTRSEPRCYTLNGPGGTCSRWPCGRPAEYAMVVAFLGEDVPLPLCAECYTDEMTRPGGARADTLTAPPDR